MDEVHSENIIRLFKQLRLIWKEDLNDLKGFDATVTSANIIKLLKNYYQSIETTDAFKKITSLFVLKLTGVENNLKEKSQEVLKI